MVKTAGIRFKKAGKIYYFDPNNVNLKVSDLVIVETVRGLEMGTVVVGIKEVKEEDLVSPLKKILRVATDKDLEVKKRLDKKQKDAYQIFNDKAKEYNLDMKLVDVECTFDEAKILFYYTADDRIDFREMVKDLASIYKIRIELRQIGVRDEAKLVNGIGFCGRKLCCSNWLSEFHPVSIKMVKDQGLSLNPTKISGICGRLMCCLKYEHEVYIELNKGMPVVGSKILTPDGEAIVISTQIIKEQVKARLIVGEEDGELVLGDDILVYKKQDISVVCNKKTS